MRPLATLFGGALDRQLAEGCPPETSRLLAARADQLVAIGARRALSEDWVRVVQLARTPSRRRSAVRPCRERLLAAEPVVRELLAALEVPLPVPARGVAMAGCLLTDGTGPLYNKDCALGLSAALHEVIAQLDPSVPLAPAPLRTR
jgi:hypothetical protein